MSDKLELITILETLATGDRREREERDRAIDSLNHGDPQDIHDTLWDTVLGCDTPSARLVERHGRSGDVLDLANKVSKQAELDVFQVDEV